MKGEQTTAASGRVTVYYDGACPACVRDRDQYEKLAGASADAVCWVDITGREPELNAIGIDAVKAMRELHVVDEGGAVRAELDAYVVLLRKISWLKPVAWFIGLPVVRPVLSRCYRWLVDRRLRREGRL